MGLAQPPRHGPELPVSGGSERRPDEAPTTTLGATTQSRHPAFTGGAREPAWPLDDTEAESRARPRPAVFSMPGRLRKRRPRWLQPLEDFRAATLKALAGLLGLPFWERKALTRLARGLALEAPLGRGGGEPGQLQQGTRLPGGRFGRHQCAGASPENLGAWPAGPGRTPLGRVSHTGEDLPPFLGRAGGRAGAGARAGPQGRSRTQSRPRPSPPRSGPAGPPRPRGARLGGARGGP